MSRIIKGIIIYSLLGFLTACSLVPQQGRALPTEENVNIPGLNGSHVIQVKAADSSKFISNNLGSEYVKYPSRTDFYWIDSPATSIMKDFNRLLPQDNWQIITDWGHPFQNALLLSTWKKENLELSILLLDDLDSVSIGSLVKNYGIAVPKAGSSLIIENIIDKTGQH